MNFKQVYIIPVIIIVFSCQNPSQTEIAEALAPMVQGQEADSLLLEVYKNNDYEPIWIESGGFNKVGNSYLDALDEVVYDGLDRKKYFTEEQARLLEKVKESKDPATHAGLDLSISRSFLSLASDLNIGRIDPDDINIEWKIERKTPTLDFGELLLSIAEGGTSALKKGIKRLRPENSSYVELQELLESQLEKETRELALVDSFPGKIEVGDSHESIPAIRKKLSYLGEVKEEPKEEDIEVYDEDLYQAVKHFQERHGLNDDGIIGQDFVHAINYSHADLITKIKVNMERLRWLPDFTKTQENKVIVNIPDFRLFYLEGGDTIFTSKVVVGKAYRQTPVFRSEMTYLVFSPTWTLPETILWEDAIPSIREDIGFLSKNNMKVLDYEGNEVDYEEVDWENLKEKEDFPYIIRQKPGGINPLGKVKFMFPNEYSIYIHDSPAQNLFTTDERTFSSGCIRMEDPDQFAAILLEGMEDWDAEEISEAMDSEEEKKVTLNQKQAVWILYLTVWNQSGKMEVREDIYNMDRKLAKALKLPVSEHFL